MSRSSEVRRLRAEWRGERQTEDPLTIAYEAAGMRPGEGKLVPMDLKGNKDHFNLHPMLANNILRSDYFRHLAPIEEFKDVVDEIYTKVKTLEPWATGTSRVPSSGFCLLFKLFTMGITEREMGLLLNNTDSPYIRGIGFLFLRYTQAPGDLWGRFEPYFDDHEPVTPGSDPRSKTTIGGFLKFLLTNIKYYGTMLPRIPVPIERKIKVYLLLVEYDKVRARNNREDLAYFVPDAKVEARYSVDGKWYPGVIESETDDGKFLVVYDEYKNKEKRGLGQIRMPGAADGEEKADSDSEGVRGRSRSRGRKDGKRRSPSRSNSRDRDREGRRPGRKLGDGLAFEDLNEAEIAQLTLKELLDYVRKREADKAVAKGKDYAARPTSYKGSLSLTMDTYTARRRSPPRRRHED